MSKYDFNDMNGQEEETIEVMEQVNELYFTKEILEMRIEQLEAENKRLWSFFSKNIGNGE